MRAQCCLNLQAMQAIFPQEIDYLPAFLPGVSMPWIQDGFLCWAHAPN